LNRLGYITTIGYLFLFSCAGTIFNPYLKDIYGIKKHIRNDVVILIDVRKLPENENTFEFKFYEPLTAVDPVRKRKRERTITSYYNDFSFREGLGTKFQRIRAKKNTDNSTIYYNLVTYIDSSNVDYNKNIEPGLIPFEILVKPDI
tara:strand:- start:425 stop:862 length:438 start_codon:yes stop_codon:yes gene_type:complete